MRLIGLILALGFALVPLAAQSQQSGKVYRLGVLSPASPPAPSDRTSVVVVLKALRELGYSEGRNLVVELRYAEGEIDRLPALARELVEFRSDAIVAVGAAGVRAAGDATKTIPIVMGFAPDAVGFGFVKSLASPGGNITGVSYWVGRGYEAKRLELLKEAVPRAARIGFLVGAYQPGLQTTVEETQKAASALGIKLVVVEVQAGDYDRAFAAMRTGQADAVLVQGTVTFNRDRKRIIALAAKHRLPAIYEWRHHAEADGGLMAYGSDMFYLSQRVASYVDRIFKGVRPADLPVEQPTKFELVINLKTAKTLGLTIPQTLLLRADQVIE
jgi:putative tryptophan/tyrosine transport system substrate-binding protein